MTCILLGVMCAAAGTCVINLSELGAIAPFLTTSAARFYSENAIVCLLDQSNGSGSLLAVAHAGTDQECTITWTPVDAESLRQCYGDLVRATENGACAIAFFLVKEFEDYTGVEQAVRGTTVDYYLTDGEAADPLPFNHAARLEVSGILAETKYNTVKSRIHTKKARHKPEQGLRTLVVIVEFSNPRAAIEEL